MDFLLIYCPLWFPLVYIFCIFSFPSISKILFLIVMFLFAETHFASTWLFFLDKDNHKWIKNNFYKVIIIPLYFLLIITFSWTFNPSFVLLIHYIASGFHVTRQSIGIVKLSKSNSSLSIFLIYLVSAICLAIGLTKPGILSSYISFNNWNIFVFITAIYILLNILFLNFDYKFIRRIIVTTTGISIYLPLLFIENLAIATVIGVGMHWCQYLAIMFALNTRKQTLANKLSLKKFLSKRIIFVLFYALIMSTLAFFGINNNKLLSMVNGSDYKFFYLIPILFQLFHFYIDGFIWKFSDTHIKESVGKYLIT